MALTKGMASRPFMYNTLLELQRQVEDIAKEVFRQVIDIENEVFNRINKANPIQTANPAECGIIRAGNSAIDPGQQRKTIQA